MIRRRTVVPGAGGIPVGVLPMAGGALVGLLGVAVLILGRRRGGGDAA